MALKAVHVSDVPNLDQVQESAALAISSSRLLKGPEEQRTAFKPPKFMVIGHRGSGMNALSSPDGRMKAIKENSLLSFNTAAKLGVEFVEFDVQVTRDGCPIIFHDNLILTEEEGIISEKRTTELTLAEFLCYGPQREPTIVGKSLLRKSTDGRVLSWKVENDDALCTLQEAFQKVESSLGFNIELKFDDGLTYSEEELLKTLQNILKVVFEYSQGRSIIFSSFQPDAALLVRKLQNSYPVFFLTNGGSDIYNDVRRNSLEEAIKLCVAGGLQGIVSEVKAIFRNPAAIPKIKEANLGILTYGQLNNVSEAVYMQHLMDVDGVIVDFVGEIAESVSQFVKPAGEESQGAVAGEEEGMAQSQGKVASHPKFSQGALSFLLKLIPNLVQ
ncbi:glycerophosphodiester phosphodiesterase GDPD1, chloroplastic-like [Nymphaea colorata]|nr:glycerophosphodiester phosphodiesterase GDPD1, chloroplastic-like [Nymphaea colorata]